MPPRRPNGHATTGPAPAEDGPRMPPLRRSESSASDTSLPDLASASSSESESDAEAALRPPRPAPPGSDAPPAPVEPPAPEPVIAPETKPGCRHGYLSIGDCQTCRTIQNEDGVPSVLRARVRGEADYADQFRRGRVIVAEMELSKSRGDIMGNFNNKLVSATKVAREALNDLHFRSTANGSDRIGMTGDEEMAEILVKARDQSGSGPNGGVVHCALVFAAHYGMKDLVIKILRKCPPHLIPALVNCTGSMYEPLAVLEPLGLTAKGIVSKDINGRMDCKTYFPMVPDKFIEDTPLVAAARRDNTEALLALLHCGADPDAAAACGATALGVACVSGFADVAEVLLGHNLRYANGEGDPVGSLRYVTADPVSSRSAADVRGDVYRCVRSSRLMDQASEYAEQWGPTDAASVQPRTMRNLLLAHSDPRQCPAVFSGRWRADPDLPCSVEMKHVGLALSRTTDATQVTAGARVSGAPLELAVRGHSLNVIEVILRAGATVEGRVMDGTPLFRRVDKTCFSRARDDEIDTEYKADEPSHAFISQVLGAILSPEICRILRTLACAGEYRLNFEKQRREELMYRLGCLMELGGSRDPDFRGNKKYEEKKHPLLG